MSSTNDKDDNVPFFKREEAVKVIIAAIERGAITFPFSGGLSKESIKKVCERVAHGTPESGIRKQDIYALANEMSGLARRDAMYLLTLLTTLMTPLTKEETEGIIRTMVE